MPKMVTIRPAKGYQAKAADKKAWEDVQARGELRVDWLTAKEAITLSKGMYEIVMEEKTPAATPVSLQQMTSAELLQLYAQLGGKTGEKQMKRSELITFITTKLDAIEVVDDEIQSDDGGE